MKELPIWRRHGPVGIYYLALMDDEDYVRVLSVGPWYAFPAKRTFYAKRRIADPDGVIRRKTERLHRFLLADSLTPTLQVDHINGNGLDCRRENMRIVTNAQNAQNTVRKPGGTSKYRGVNWIKADRCWAATVTHHGEQVWLGRFSSEEEAARVAAAARAEVMPWSVESRHPVPGMDK